MKPTAAQVAPVEDLTVLAAQINSKHEAIEGNVRTTLKMAKEAGDLLIRAKAACGHGKWLPWLEKNVRFNRQTSAAYMRVANNWDKCTTVVHLADAYELMSRKESEEPPTPPEPESPTTLTFPQQQQEDADEPEQEQEWAEEDKPEVAEVP